MRFDHKTKNFLGPCKKCGSAYTGYGFRGQFQFNSSKLKDIGILHTTYDYYNTTFSLKNKAVGIQYNNV